MNKKKENKSLIEKFTPQQVMDILKDTVMEGNAKEMIRKLGEEILPLGKSEPENLENRKKLGEIAHKALYAYGLETHFLLSETVEEKERPFVVEFSRQLVEEYNCKTAGEKALAEIIVNAHARVLRYSRELNSGTAADEVTTKHIPYFAILSKELDRANRQFLNAFATLIQIKSPIQEINIMAKTAFVAQNQQVNINKDDAKKNDREIIDYK